MNSTRIDLDVIVIGGGVAGLWSLAALRGAGYRAALFEREAIGGGQSAASQGMIHGGIKYALGGGRGASAALAAMPSRWQASLRDGAAPDLRAAAPAVHDLLLWSERSLAARTAGLLAATALQGPVRTLGRAELPAPLGDPRFRGRAWRLQDFAVDVVAVCAALAGQHADHLFGIDWRQAQFLRDSDGAVRGIALPGLELRAARVLLCAGAGNEELIARLGARAPAMQRRPLHQVLLKHPSLPPLFGHCIGAGARPRLSVSSHRAADGTWTWYLGGELAETGAQRTGTAQIAAAQALLAALFPGLDLAGAAWRTLRIDRAEARQPARHRPDDAWLGPVEGAAQVLAAWPTKLTLAPRLAERVLERLRGLQASGRALGAAELHALESACGRPPPAAPPWASLFA